MKKIFTLFVSLTIVATTFAQFSSGGQKNYGYEKGKKDVAYNDKKYKKDNDGYFFSKREMQMQVNEINREYDLKIQSVKNRFFMTRFRRDRIINNLEAQRNMELKKVYAKFNDRHNRFDDHDQRRNW